MKSSLSPGGSAGGVAARRLRALGEVQLVAQAPLAQHATVGDEVDVDAVERGIVELQHPVQRLRAAHAQRQLQPHRVGRAAEVTGRAFGRCEARRLRQHVFDGQHAYRIAQ